MANRYPERNTAAKPKTRHCAWCSFKCWWAVWCVDKWPTKFCHYTPTLAFLFFSTILIFRKDRSCGYGSTPSGHRDWWHWWCPVRAILITAPSCHLIILPKSVCISKLKNAVVTSSFIVRQLIGTTKQISIPPSSLHCAIESTPSLFECVINREK